MIDGVEEQSLSSLLFISDNSTYHESNRVADEADLECWNVGSVVEIYGASVRDVILKSDDST